MTDGDVLYNWLLLELNQVALKARDLINSGAFVVETPTLADEADAYLKGYNNGSE